MNNSTSYIKLTEDISTKDSSSKSFRDFSQSAHKKIWGDSKWAQSFHDKIWGHNGNTNGKSEEDIHEK